MSQLGAQEVQTVFMSCLFTEEECARGIPKDLVEVPGIHRRFGFHPGRLEAARPKVREFLEQLPDSFHMTGGKGFTFLGLHKDREGNQWGEHTHCEQLMVLAIGLGMGGYCFPRPIWPSLPGSLPYVWFDPRVGNGKS